ncbi:MAG TPA: hypothetical protein VGL70_01510 [Candidatus Binatia bacterium]
MRDVQEKIELSVFKEFAEVCSYKIRSDSIEKRAEPEPDILCELVGEGSVAFELGEIVDEVFARQVEGEYKIRKRFDAASKKFPALRSSLADALVYIEFFDEVSHRMRLNSIEPILEFLHFLEPCFEGDAPVWKHAQLEKVIRGIEINRGLFKGPVFTLAKFVEDINRSLDLLQKKFAKSYETGAPVDLLAYFLRQSPSRDNRWVEDVRGYVARKLNGSSFRRVWIYNRFDRKIVYVFPEL